MSEDSDSSNSPAIGGTKWWVREIVSITSWLLIIFAPFSSQYLDKEILGWIARVVTTENVAISVFLVLGASWLIGLRTMWHVAFIAAYPIILPLRVLPKLCIRHWPILFIFLPGIRGLVRGMRLRSGLLCIALAAIVAAFSFSNPSVLIFCWITLCGYLAWIFAHQIHMAYRPATAYSELVEILQHFSSKFPSPKEMVAKLKNPASPSQEAKVDAERSKAANLFVLYGVSTALHYVARHLEALQKSFKLDIYLVWCVAKTFVLTIAVFTVIFASMGFANVANFKSEMEGPIGVASYLMFSFCNLMTSDVSGIQAVSELARSFACVELFFAFGLLVLVVFVVFTSLRDRHRTDLQAVVSKFQSASSAISDMFESDFALTRSAVEGIVLGFAPPLAKHLIALQHGKAYAETLYNEHKQATQEHLKVVDVESVDNLPDKVSSPTPVKAAGSPPKKKRKKQK